MHFQQVAPEGLRDIARIEDLPKSAPGQYKLKRKSPSFICTLILAAVGFIALRIPGQAFGLDSGRAICMEHSSINVNIWIIY
jgi:hypothetical protein